MEHGPPSLPGSLSLQKGLLLFERILHDRGRTPLKELARDMALPTSTLYRLIGALERHGLVVRTGRGHFDVGLPLVDALRDVSIPDRLAQASRPALRRLARACGATAHLGVLEGDMVTYLVKVSARGANTTASFTQEHGQLEAYCSGVGKILLAYLPEDERRNYLANGPFVPLTARTITDPAMLQASLEAARTDGFARDDGEFSDDIYCLSVPVWLGRRRVIAAISLTCMRRDHSHERDEAYLRVLRGCAAEIGAKLRGVPVSPRGSSQNAVEENPSGKISVSFRGQ